MPVVCDMEQGSRPLVHGGSRSRIFLQKYSVCYKVFQGLLLNAYDINRGDDYRSCVKKIIKNPV